MLYTEGKGCISFWLAVLVRCFSSLYIKSRPKPRATVFENKCLVKIESNKILNSRQENSHMFSDITYISYHTSFFLNLGRTVVWRFSFYILQNHEIYSHPLNLYYYFVCLFSVCYYLDAVVDQNFWKWIFKRFWY